MSFLKEFREFAMKGNVMDLAVGVIIGAAFGRIVTALVENVLMPVIGIFTGPVNFSDRYILLSNSKGSGFPSLDKAKEAGAPVLAYGAFIQAVFEFIIIAFCVFLLIKVMNRLIRKKEVAAAPAELSTQEKLLTEIRDILRK